MAGKRNRKEHQERELRQAPDEGTRIGAAKNQSYALPLPLWQDLVEEVARRRKMGLTHASQNAVAIAGITEWLAKHKGATE